jgi:hypothetical protein
MAPAMTAAVFKPHILANRCLYRDMSLLTDILAHTM